MKKLIAIERSLLMGHIISMAFGLAGLLLVLPNAEFIASLPDFGKVAFRWSMAGGGVVYMVLGTAAVAVYAYRTLGLKHWLTFMFPAVLLSLCSELLGTSTGFPFGHYHYLNGLGYKIAGLVPFTIPLSWFYLGLSSYLLARVGLENLSVPKFLKLPTAIALGALLLTSWDFVLDPAMSQTVVPFWMWEQPGAFFGMPYQNFAGWMGTGAVFMTVATFLWKKTSLKLSRQQLLFPLIVYLSNIAFSTVMSLGSGFWVPVVLGMFTGVLPAIILYFMAKSQQEVLEENLQNVSSETVTSDRPRVPVM